MTARDGSGERIIFLDLFTLRTNVNTRISHSISDDNINVEQSDNLKRKVVEEKRQREHILQLNQILAKQVMEKSKMVAGTLNPSVIKT